ncbi:TIGR02556 family CRISPR-associated protein [Fervidobacterium nodosum]|uniref:TIGR02556 family CRISPR-associated protein n=1 Tax=Fervidobacterium nodosum TaxID=2424 RepID=UPI003B75C66B
MKNLLEGIVQIGRALLENKSLIDSLIKELPAKDKKGNLYHVLKLKFSKENLELDVSEEIDSDTARKYLYIGTADGPNAPQWYAANNKITYFLSETLFNLTNIDFGEPLNQKLKHIFEKFYVDLGPGIKSKYRYALNLYYLDPNVDVRKLYEEYSKQNQGNDKGFLKVLEKQFEKILFENYEAKLNEFGLFVIYIDGEPLSKYEEYRRKVLEYKSSGEKSETSSKKEKSKDLRCNICGSTENLTDDLKKMKIKYYTNDKITFASELDPNKFYKNMVICQNCLNAILAAETYLDNKLKTKLGDLSLYIFPHFIYGEPLNESELDLVVDKIINSYNIVKNLKGVQEFEEKILGITDENRYFLVNFLFFKKSQQATKIRRFIKDVPPSIFDRIAEASKCAREIVKKAIQMNYETYIDLQKIYYLIPVKVSAGEVTEYKYILDFYESLLTFKPIEKETLIGKFIEATKVIYLQKNGYNINKDSLEFYILNANMLVKFLEKMGNLKEGNTLDTSKLNVREDIKNYISTMGYDEQQSAMFLLGILIGEIGNSQYKKYNSDKKPILNKLNFNGIDKSKIIKIANEVYAKLEQEKIRKYHETTYAEMKRLLDENLKNWKLNKNENLFYILSGYSYATLKTIMKGETENG